jgi:hypothetical protein
MHCESTFHLVCGPVVADARGGVANLVELSEISSEPNTGSKAEKCLGRADRTSLGSTPFENRRPR